MKGKRTAPEKAEEIKALSLIYSPDAISARLAIPVRTVYHILSKRDDPKIEARREQKRIELVDRVWDDKEAEVTLLKDKCDMILDGLNKEKVDKARLTELSTAYGTLFDKIRLIQDRSTQNFSVRDTALEVHELIVKHRGRLEDLRNMQDVVPEESDVL